MGYTVEVNSEEQIQIIEDNKIQIICTEPLITIIIDNAEDQKAALEKANNLIQQTKIKLFGEDEEQPTEQSTEEPTQTPTAPEEPTV